MFKKSMRKHIFETSNICFLDKKKRKNNVRVLAVCMKTKHFFLKTWQKLGILIPDLYLYSIKIQTDIDQNAVTKLQKITDFLKSFLKF
jgi:hypothetical protein